MDYDNETLAARIVATETGCCYRRLDMGGKSVSDFELLTHDGSQIIGELEVTSYVIPKHLEQSIAIHEMNWSCKRLKYIWHLNLSHNGVNIKRLPSKLPALLSQLEAQDSYISGQLVLHLNKYIGQEPYKSLLDLGVSGIAWREEPAADQSSGGIRLWQKEPGGFVSSAFVTPAVEAEISKPDNKQKLGRRSGLSRREIFIWLDNGSMASIGLMAPYEGTPVADFIGGGLSPPRLPEEITRVWAATGRHETTGCMGLWYSDGSDWVVVTPKRLRCGGHSID